MKKLLLILMSFIASSMVLAQPRLLIDLSCTSANYTIYLSAFKDMKLEDATTVNKNFVIRNSSGVEMPDALNDCHLAKTKKIFSFDRKTTDFEMSCDSYEYSGDYIYSTPIKGNKISSSKFIVTRNSNKADTKLKFSVKIVRTLTVGKKTYTAAQLGTCTAIEVIPPFEDVEGEH